jgi:hypothetical protein
MNRKRKLKVNKYFVNFLVAKTLHCAATVEWFSLDNNVMIHKSLHGLSEQGENGELDSSLNNFT